MLDKAILIAAQEHLSVTDKGGNPYILHPLRIMMRLRTTDQELMSIAVLHDVVEDSPNVTITSLRAEGFSERVLTGLSLLTHPPTESYDDYITRIAGSGNLDAIRVKLEDLRDNSDITRMKGLREKDFQRLEKYHRAFQRLTEAKRSLQRHLIS